jgi:hypothetical protein
MSFLFKLVQPREFKYYPRYYKPEKEVDEETGKRRMHFRRLFRHPRPPKKPTTFWLFLLIIVLYLYWQLNNHTRSSRPIKVEQIKLEEVAQ